jgi:lysophospholipase L1-like esterase
MEKEKDNFIKRISQYNEPSVRFNFKLHLHWFFLLLTLPYLLWEIYWANKVGYACIKWHTRLMVYVYVWQGVYLFLHYTQRKKQVMLFQIVLTVFSAVTVTLMMAEFFVSAFKINETFVEKIGAGYKSFYSATGESKYHANLPNKKHWITKQEYNYERFANSLGFSDREWSLTKKKYEKRILALGDSFTEGDGAPDDSSYVSLLREKLDADSLVYVMNAGVCGSDPFINFVNYRDRLSNYHPGIILQTLSSGDINVDLMVRGGMERFLLDGTVQFKKAPWWEPIYAVSFLSRFYFNAGGYNQLLLRDADIAASKKELDEQMIELFKNYAALAQKNQCKLVIVLQPFLGEVNSNAYQYDFTEILSALKKRDNISVIDLLPFYRQEIRLEHTVAQNYYWPIDGHHNSTGYRLMAEGIYEQLVNDSLLLSESNNLQ